MRFYRAFAVLLLIGALNNSVCATPSACVSTLIELVKKSELPGGASEMFLKYGIASFRLEGVADELERVDLAEFSQELAPAGLQGFAKHVSETLHKIAGAFGSDFSAMFSQNPIELRLAANPLGPAGSYEGVVGVFPDWSPEEGIPGSVFAHEFTHQLAADPEIYGEPLVLKELCEFFVFNEFIADWVAYKSVGTLDFVIPNLDLKGFSMRGGDLVSFDLPAAKFSYARGKEEILTWIKSAAKKSNQTKRGKMFITGLRSMLSEELQHEGQDFESNARLEDLENIRVLDQHQLGMPLFYFFRDLEKAVGRDFSSDFRRALEVLSAQDSTDQVYSVHLEGYDKSPEDFIRVVLKTPRHFFSLFRDHLSSEREKAEFDRLFQERNIAKGLLLEENFIVQPSVALKAQEVMRSRFRANDGKGEGIYNPSNPFYDRDHGMKYPAPIVISKIQ